MFVKNSLVLQDTVDHILTIFEMLIVNLGGLDEAEKLEQWRNAVRDIWQELKTLAFLDWCQALFPPIESIANHPWLLTIKQRYDAGLQVQPLAPTTEAVGSTLSATPTRPPSTSSLSMVPHVAPKGSAGHIPMQSTPSGKGKAQATSEGKVAMVEEIAIPCEDDKRDKSEDVEEDIEMDDIEPSPTKPPPKLLPATPPHLAIEIHLIPPSLHCSHNKLIPPVNYAIAPPLRHDSSAYDQMIGCIDDGEWQIVHVMHQITVPTPGTVEDHM
ncbi:hypothetical protein F5141DRAFT_1066124 [Pisolithus sp. B1]|nr:hypothetical protein F5141DRAFT_1066124 [Pisolithus sp. B1]